MAMAISVEGRAYIATGEGIRVFDLLDLSEVVQVDTLPVSVPVRSMAIQGNDLFIAAGAEGLNVMDISTPGSTVPLAAHFIPGESLYLAGRKIYIGGSGGLHWVQAGLTLAATFDVQIVDFAFVPATVNITKGDTVRWVWMAGGHSTTSGSGCVVNGIWNSGVLAAGSTFSRVFNTAGSFPYFCIPHCGMGMVGTVKVAALPPGINMSVTPVPVGFGKAGIGQSSDKVITIKNAATSIGPLTGNVGAPSAPFSVISGGGAFTLNPGQSTSVLIRFSPSAVGVFSGTLAITHNANNQTSPTNVQFKRHRRCDTCSHRRLDPIAFFRTKPQGSSERRLSYRTR